MRTRPFTIYELREVMAFLAKGFNTSILFEQDFYSSQMIEIWLGFRDGLDVSSFARPEISPREMSNMRVALMEKRQSPK